MSELEKRPAGSGGPATEDGKAISRWNATRHGISSPAPVIAGLETKDDWREHRDGILESLSPVGALEKNLAERVALSLWRLHRVTRFETAAIGLGVEKVEDTIHERKRIMRPALSNPLAATHPEDVRSEARHNKASYNAMKRFTSSWRGTEKKLGSRDASSVVFGAYMTARKLSGQDFEAEDVELPGIPDDHDIYEPPPMKASDVQRCVEALASRAGVDVEEVLEHAIENARLEASSSRIAVEQTEKAVEDLRRERVLPDEKVLEKIQKYESHLSRQLYHALHELENLQKHRLTGKGTPLARLDVQGVAEG